VYIFSGRVPDVLVEVSLEFFRFDEMRYIIMATTGELRAIIEELQLIDIGDAASYLGEETQATESLISNLTQEGLSGSQAERFSTYTASCTESSFS
jgi:hypothetical protein